MLSTASMQQLEAGLCENLPFYARCWCPSCIVQAYLILLHHYENIGITGSIDNRYLKRFLQTQPENQNKIIMTNKENSVHASRAATISLGTAMSILGRDKKNSLNFRELHTVIHEYFVSKIFHAINNFQTNDPVPHYR